VTRINGNYGGWNQHSGPNPSVEAFIDKAISYDQDDCPIWPFSIGGKGYARANRYGRIGRYICTKVYGPPLTSKHQAAHSPKCISKACINHNHLRWATQAENFADDRIGEDHSLSKRTEEEVIEIRRLYRQTSITQAELGERFNIHQVQVSQIITRKVWAWLEEPCDAELIFATTRPRMKDLFA
jgi:hypothetical protein